MTQETTALSCRARGMASVREGGKVDGSGTQRSWPFIQAQRSLAGPQRHGTPLWIVGRHEAAPCRSDVICITFRALHWYFSHTTTRKREYNGSTSFEAEPLSVTVSSADAGGYFAPAVFPWPFLAAVYAMREPCILGETRVSTRWRLRDNLRCRR